LFSFPIQIKTPSLIWFRTFMCILLVCVDGCSRRF
jgi:hypothetical protein